jgi:hypothetical protein
MGIRLFATDVGTLRALLDLGQLELNREGAFLIIRGHSVDETMGLVNEALGILRSSGVGFRQLRPREVIEMVLGEWLT